MADILTPQQAAYIAGVSVETLRRWRRDNTGPPYVMQGGKALYQDGRIVGAKPRYRSDMLAPGTYEVQGLQTRFPAPKTELRDMTGMSEAKQAMLREMIDEMPVMPLEDTDDLVFVADGLDTSDPQVQAVIRTLGTMVRQIR